LIANAGLHGGPPLRVVIDERGTSLRCSVHDTNPSHPRSRRPDVAAPHGRGLLLVDALADRWGIEPLDAGKVVWFELDR
jgi:hypothetical protein